MLKRSSLMVALMILILPTLVFAHGGESTMADAVADYAAIGKLLAADKVDGIAKHANGMLKIMDEHEAMMKDGEGHHDMKNVKMDDDHMKGEDMPSMEKMQEMHKAMRGALTTLSKSDLKLEDARSAYKDLSLQFVPMAKMGYERRGIDPKWVVMMCPMVKAEWVQVDGKVTNPYYGTKMLRCGSKVASLGSDASEGKASSSSTMKGSEHYGGGSD